MANNARKKVLLVTSSRSDFGSIERLLSLMKRDQEIVPVLFATGDHMSVEAGETYRHIEDTGAVIDEKYKLKAHEPALQVGEVVAATSHVISKHSISYVFLCGDRKETFGAAVAAALSKVPIFHIHGGDVTFGMIDDAMRHAITKLSSVHFPASPLSARRIAQMGEEAWRIHVTGSPDTDNLNEPLPEAEVLAKFALAKREYALMLLNPETLLDALGNTKLAEETLAALAHAWGKKVVAIYPNNDPSAQGIRNTYDAHEGELALVRGLPRTEYLSLLKNAAFLIGNSSSGITEAASFKTPVVNVGSRQAGRERNENVLDAEAREPAIARAIAQATDARFLASIEHLANLYGVGGSSERIYRAFIEIISAHDTVELLYKKFILL